MAKPLHERSVWKVGVVARDLILEDMAEYRPIIEGNNEGAAIAYGDLGLLHAVADRMGWKQRAWRTTKRVLDALTKHSELPESLFERWVLRCQRPARMFRLKPEHVYAGPLRPPSPTQRRPDE